MTIAGAAAFFIWSLKALDTLKAPLEPGQEKFALAKLAMHAVISVAFMIFAYNVLRISERMVLPNWWKPSLRKTMLGFRDPISNVTKLTTELTRLVEKLTDKIIPEKPEK